MSCAPATSALAAGTLVLDALKAVAPCSLPAPSGRKMRPWWPRWVLSFGHCFPVWLGFKGGKGVAVMIGSLLALAWPVGLIFCAVWLLIAFTRKISSLAALTAAATAPIFAYVIVDERLAVTVLGLALLLFFQHRTNMARLIAGTEPTIGGSRKPG